MLSTKRYESGRWRWSAVVRSPFCPSESGTVLFLLHFFIILFTSMNGAIHECEPTHISLEMFMLRFYTHNFFTQCPSGKLLRPEKPVKLSALRIALKGEHTQQAEKPRDERGEKEDDDDDIINHLIFFPRTISALCSIILRLHCPACSFTFDAAFVQL